MIQYYLYHGYLQCVYIYYQGHAFYRIYVFTRAVIYVLYALCTFCVACAWTWQTTFTTLDNRTFFTCHNFLSRYIVFFKRETQRVLKGWREGFRLITVMYPRDIIMIYNYMIIPCILIMYTPLPINCIRMHAGGEEPCMGWYDEKVKCTALTIFTDYWCCYNHDSSWKQSRHTTNNHIAGYFRGTKCLRIAQIKSSMIADSRPHPYSNTDVN